MLSDCLGVGRSTLVVVRSRSGSGSNGAGETSNGHVQPLCLVLRRDGGGHDLEFAKELHHSVVFGAQGGLDLRPEDLSLRGTQSIVGFVEGRRDLHGDDHLKQDACFDRALCGNNADLANGGDEVRVECLGPRRLAVGMKIVHDCWGGPGFGVEGWGLNKLRGRGAVVAEVETEGEEIAAEVDGKEKEFSQVGGGV